MIRPLVLLLAITTLVLVGRVQSQDQEAPPPKRVGYTGEYTFTTEVEQNGETCVRWQPKWPIVGAFYVENETNSTMKIREEALGCAIDLATEGKRTHASDVDCAWVGPVNAQALGMTKRTYSSFEIDFEQDTIAAEGQFDRTLKNGTVMVTCFKFSGELQAD